MPSRWANDKDTRYTPDAILAYNTNTNDISNIINYPETLSTNSHSALFHKDTNSIYILNGDLLKFDLNTQKITSIHEKIEGVGSYPGFISIGDKIHIFGTKKYIHYIYDYKSQSLIQQKINVKYYQCDPHSVVYLKSKNRVLIFSMNLNQIYVYFPSNQQWDKRTITFESKIIQMRYTDITATSDGKYVIIVGRKVDILI